MVKKGTPDNVKKIIIDAFQKAYDDPAYKELEKKEMTNLVPGYMKADEFRKSWDTEFDGYHTVFSELGLVKQK